MVTLILREARGLCSVLDAEPLMTTGLEGHNALNVEG